MPKEGKKKGTSDAINRVLGTDGIDFARLTQADLDKLVRCLDKPGELLRHLGKLEIKSRARNRAEEFAEEATGLLSAALEERPLGRLARGLLKS